jgi:hypothetical protein
MKVDARQRRHAKGAEACEGICAFVKRVERPGEEEMVPDDRSLSSLAGCLECAPKPMTVGGFRCQPLANSTMS